MKKDASSDIVIYRAQDGKTQIDVNLPCWDVFHRRINFSFNLGKPKLIFESCKHDPGSGLDGRASVHNRPIGENIKIS
jgi:hypothetical protein